jgi:hypothetical protein
MTDKTQSEKRRDENPSRGQVSSTPGHALRAARAALEGVDPLVRRQILTALAEDETARLVPRQRLPLAFGTVRGAKPHPQPELTARQLVVLRFIAKFIADNEIAPTLREIGAGVGITSTNGVVDHLIALERKGCITRSSMHSRAIRVLVEVE